jgi:hypothetical protein
MLDSGVQGTKETPPFTALASIYLKPRHSWRGVRHVRAARLAVGFSPPRPAANTALCMGEKGDAPWR